MRRISDHGFRPFLVEWVECGEQANLRYGSDHGVALRHVGALVGTRAHRELWPEILRSASACAASPIG